jgi:transketolase
MPSQDLFLAQDAKWRDSVLPPGGRRVSIEAASPMSWRRIVGDSGLIIGIDHFGESAPYQALAEHFGFTPEKVAKRVVEWLG